MKGPVVFDMESEAAVRPEDAPPVPEVGPLDRQTAFQAAVVRGRGGSRRGWAGGSGRWAGALFTLVLLGWRHGPGSRTF